MIREYMSGEGSLEGSNALLANKAGGTAAKRSIHAGGFTRWNSHPNGELTDVWGFDGRIQVIIQNL